MSEDRSTEILKNAILLEKRGHAFYSKVAQQAEGEAVRNFFQLMAEEEANHIRILSEQFKSYRSSKKFRPGDYAEQAEFKTTTAILTQDLKRQLAAGSLALKGSVLARLTPDPSGATGQSPPSE